MIIKDLALYVPKSLTKEIYRVTNGKPEYKYLTPAQIARVLLKKGIKAESDEKGSDLSGIYSFRKFLGGVVGMCYNDSSGSVSAIMA